MFRASLRTRCVALAALAISCAWTPGSNDAPRRAVVQFDFAALKPATVRIPADGTVAWSNIAADSRGFVVFPESAASGFSCGVDLGSHFQKTSDGYVSPPIDSFESPGVELPCPLQPGTYDYEIWIMGTGVGTTDPGRPERKLPGKIVVE
jgi:hypothetical protein